MKMRHIGWAAVGSDGLPLRPSRSGYSWQTGLTSPPRIYTTAKRAAAIQGAVSVAKVYIGDAEEVTQ